jgi:hypothetical protein
MLRELDAHAVKEVASLREYLVSEFRRTEGLHESILDGLDPERFARRLTEREPSPKSFCLYCGAAFLPGTRWQKFCRPEHRKAFASRSAAFKEKRRVYMQKHRKDERERDQRALERVRKIH